VVWLGGLFTPEAYITATRQHVAQANAWSLEELHLHVAVHDEPRRAAAPPLDDRSFPLTGLQLQGAVCHNNLISLATQVNNAHKFKRFFMCFISQALLFYLNAVIVSKVGRVFSRILLWTK
jgi:hypothetical protein